MSVLLDVIGSVIIGGTLILMMMTFQLQLQETSQRVLYASSMIEHMDAAASKLNKVFSLAGIGIPVDSICVTAQSSRVVLKTFWDCNSDTLSGARHNIEIKLATTNTQYGRALEITQDGTALEDLGYIMYVESVSFVYYDRNGSVTTTSANVRSADVLLTFRRDSSWRPDRPLRTTIQIKCFLMNSYLQGA